jgi:hypothetical protein
MGRLRPPWRMYLMSWHPQTRAMAIAITILKVMTTMTVLLFLLSATRLNSLTVDFPRSIDTSDPHDEARSKASGLIPPRWLCRRVRL